MKNKIYHGVKGERITVAEKQNRGKPFVCSPKYGSMTFWKNVDFWQSVLLYAGMIILFYSFGMLAGLIQ
jgi:hypothetical protein